VRFATPPAGSHTEEILAGLGYGTTEIDAMRAAGAI
jgi:crotonobetainyl-CoA:carnitine CoA-transferase CaiB-like acyl-CoA transferase